MISFSGIQDIASDLEFASAMLSPCPDIDRHESWWLGPKEGEAAREIVRVAESLSTAAEILKALTIEQVEALPGYLNR